MLKKSRLTHGGRDMAEEEDLSGVLLDWDHKTDRDPEELLAELLELRPAMLRGFQLAERYAYASGKGLPRWFFETAPRVVPQFSIEFAVLRVNGPRFEVWLRQRPADDPFWPSQWHMPGTCLYTGGDDIDGMWRRIMRELNKGGDITLKHKPKFTGTLSTSREERSRGPCAHDIWYAFVEERTEIAGGQFFPLPDFARADRAPDSVIAHHRRFLEHLHDYID